MTNTLVNTTHFLVIIDSLKFHVEIIATPF